MAERIQLRRDTAADWTSNNPILAEGEYGYETDTGKHKIGNGVGTWTALPYNSDVSWGSIIGTLSNQTDLQAALDLKATSSSVTAKANKAGDTFTGEIVTQGGIDNQGVAKNGKTILTSSSGQVNWVGNEGNMFEITLTEDTVLNNPSSPVDNAPYTFRVKQDGSGLHTLTFGSNFRFAGGNAPSVTLDVNAVDYFSFVVDGSNIDGSKLQNLL